MVPQWPLWCNISGAFCSHFTNIEPCSQLPIAHYPSHEYSSTPLNCAFPWILMQRSAKPVSTYCSRETRDLPYRVSRSRARLFVGLHPWRGARRTCWGSLVWPYRKLNAFPLQQTWTRLSAYHLVKHRSTLMQSLWTACRWCRTVTAPRTESSSMSLNFAHT